MNTARFDKVELSPSDLLQGDIRLASPPEIYTRLNRLMDEADSTNEMLAEVIERDPAITARILKLANSAFFALPQEVYRITDAITFVGRMRVRDLVLATEVVQRFDHIPDDLVDIYSFWRNSLRCAIFSRCLSAQVTQRHCDTETMFLAGLLHDIGHLVLYTRTPELGKEALLEHKHRGIPLYRTEHELMGFNYADLGAALATLWDLPDLLRSVIGSHVSPELATEYQFESAILNIASNISAQGSFDIEIISTLLPPELPVWQLTGLSPSDLETVISNAQQDFSQALALLH